MASPRLEWLPVARWEVLRVVKRKDFLFSVLLLPVLLLGVGLVISWFKGREAGRESKIAVVFREADGAASARTMRPAKGFTWVTPAPEEQSIEALKQAVAARRVEGALLLPPDYAASGEAQIVVRRSRPAWKAKLEKLVLEQARLDRGGGLGLDSAALARLDAAVKTGEVVALPGGEVSRSDRGAAVILMMMLIMALFVSVSYMAIGITGEKQARVTEVIVSAIRPQSWIDGKIAAYTIIGLAEVVLWSAALFVMALMFRVPPPGGVDAGMLAMSSLLFLLGLLLYVALYATILATIKDLQSTSKLQAYLYFLPFVPFFFMEGVIGSPDATWVMIVSQVPFFSPFLMPVRLAIGAAAWWEVALALVLLAITAHLLRRAAGAAFRIGMLMYGKELSLPELARWARRS